MLNLNKKLISKKALLEYIEDIDVYRLYTNQEVDLAYNILSPLREENKPSFGYFIGQSGEICWNDFVLGNGDFVDFVKRFVKLKRGVDLNFFEVLSQIATDFNLTEHFQCIIMPKFRNDEKIKKFKTREDVLQNVNITNLGVRSREWKTHDLLFWEQFGITKKILESYAVKAIDYIFFKVDKPPILADKYAYVFYEKKDDLNTIKIYQPFNKVHKWLNNHNESVWQGWMNLPKDGEKVIITKSLKDVMSIVSVLGIPAVALQSESIMPKQHILDELYSRFEDVYLFYDNDFNKEINMGQLLGYKVAKDQPMIQIQIPDKFKCKDFSDLTKKYGQDKAKEIYNTCIEMPY